MADDFSIIPNDAIVYVPGSFRLFHSRSSQSAHWRSVRELVNLSRHRRHTLIFDVQDPAHLDRSILSEVDLVLVKEPGPFQQGSERSQFRAVMDEACAAFPGVSQRREKRAILMVAPGAEIAGKLVEHSLPNFWSDGLFWIFEDVPAGNLGETARTRDD